VVGNAQDPGGWSRAVLERRPASNRLLEYISSQVFRHDGIMDTRQHISQDHGQTLLVYVSKLLPGFRRDIADSRPDDAGRPVQCSSTGRLANIPHVDLQGGTIDWCGAMSARARWLQLTAVYGRSSTLHNLMSMY
jgi:hypothetical protein